MKRHRSGVAIMDSDDDFENDSDYDDEQMQGMHNFARDEFGNEIEINEDEFEDEMEGPEDVLDDQDIDDQDREVLNDRILGIINVFQHIVQSNNSQQQLSSKQVKALQELGQKKMSIEKTSDRKQVLRGLQDLNIAGQAIKNPNLAKDNEDRKQPPGGNLRSSFYLNSSNSNKELQAFGSAVPRKHVHNRE